MSWEEIIIMLAFYHIWCKKSYILLQIHYLIWKLFVMILLGYHFVWHYLTKLQKCIIQNTSGIMGFCSGIVNVVHEVTLPTKVHTVKAMVFPVVMYRCESWAIKKAEHWEIDAFELWCWRRFSRVLCTARRSNKSILKEINPKYSLEGLMLNLKLPYFSHLMWRADSTEKTLMLGKAEGKRRKGWQRMR